MDTIQELALSTADVVAITPKVISKTIEEVARGKRVMSQMFKENRDLVRQPGNEISFPKKGTGIAFEWDVGAGQTVSPSSFAYDAVTIKVVRVGGQLRFDRDALDAALRDVIADHIEEAGIEYAELLDAQAWIAAIGRKETTISISNGSIGTTSDLPLVSIKSVSGGTISSVDYHSGTIILTGSVAAATIVAYFADNLKSTGLYRDSGNTLVGKDILLLKSQVEGENFSPNIFICHPDHLAELLYDANTKFLDASAYGGREPLLRGELGQVFGLKVLVTSRIPKSSAIVVDTARLGYHVVKRPLESIREEKPEFYQIWYHLWGKENFGVVNEKAIGLISNLTSSSVSPLSD